MDNGYILPFIRTSTAPLFPPGGLVLVNYCLSLPLPSHSLPALSSLTLGAFGVGGVRGECCLPSQTALVWISTTFMVERKLTTEEVLSANHMPWCTSIHIHAHMHVCTENKVELKKQISNSHLTLKPLWMALRNWVANKMTEWTQKRFLGESLTIYLPAFNVT